MKIILSSNPVFFSCASIQSHLLLLARINWTSPSLLSQVKLYHINFELLLVAIGVTQLISFHMNHKRRISSTHILSDKSAIRNILESLSNILNADRFWCKSPHSHHSPPTVTQLLTFFEVNQLNTPISLDCVHPWKGVGYMLAFQVKNLKSRPRSSMLPRGFRRRAQKVLSACGGG